MYFIYLLSHNKPPSSVISNKDLLPCPVSSWTAPLPASSELTHAALFSWRLSCTCDRGQKTLSIKGQVLNILGFDGHMVSVANTEVCH